MATRQHPLFVRIGQNVRIFRTRKHISQERLAQLAKCYRTHIGKLERGEINPTALLLHNIAKALEVDIRALFQDPVTQK